MGGLVQPALAEPHLLLFHKHDRSGKIVRGVAKWPLPLLEKPRKFGTSDDNVNENENDVIDRAD